MRGLPEMVEPYNAVTYHGRLVHASSTELSSRPIAQAVREFNTMNYGRESNVIYFDLRDVNSEILASGSIYNEGSCAFAMTIIEGLIFGRCPRFQGYPYSISRAVSHPHVRSSDHDQNPS
jgi:hypothetical protein